MPDNKRTKDKVEERVSVRRDILETFQIFLTMPHLGSQRIVISDLSLTGIAFIADPGMQFKEGSILECYLHLNKSIRIPLTVTVIHLQDDSGFTKAGCGITGTESSAYKAYSNFVQLLISLTEFKKA